MLAEAGVVAAQGDPAIDGPLLLDSPVRTAVLGFLVAAALVFVLTPLMGRLAHRTGAVDTPTDGRRMHEMAMPLLGGLGIYLAWMVPVMVFVKVDRPVWGIIGGATIVVAVGLFDDLYELEPIVKFIGQLLAIGVAIYFDIHINRIGMPFTDVMWYLHPAVSVVVTAFWMAMIINMVNFIDGLDGLAAGVCGISALTFCIIALSTNFPAAGVIAAILAGATFAFLRFNFHPASIFMGDAGSMLLGFVLACLSVQSVMKGTAAIALVLPLLVLGVPFVDLSLIVWRRWRRGVPFYSPGQDHVHHDLVLVHGFSQRKSVLLLYSLVHPAQRPRHRHPAREQLGQDPARHRRHRGDGVHAAAAQPLPLAAPRPAGPAGAGRGQQPARRRGEGGAAPRPGQRRRAARGRAPPDRAEPAAGDAYAARAADCEAAVRAADPLGTAPARARPGAGPAGGRSARAAPQVRGQARAARRRARACAAGSCGGTTPWWGRCTGPPRSRWCCGPGG